MTSPAMRSVAPPVGPFRDLARDLGHELAERGGVAHLRVPRQRGVAEAIEIALATPADSAGPAK